jgi:predicted RNase H-like nuclease (RuvC/YqgF family)
LYNLQIIVIRDYRKNNIINNSGKTTVYVVYTGDDGPDAHYDATEIIKGITYHAPIFDLDSDESTESSKHSSKSLSSDEFLSAKSLDHQGKMIEDLTKELEKCKQNMKDCAAKLDKCENKSKLTNKTNKEKAEKYAKLQGDKNRLEVEYNSLEDKYNKLEEDINEIIEGNQYNILRKIIIADGNLKLAKSLFNKGVDINATNIDGNTILMDVVNEGGLVKTVKFLLDNGANASIVNNKGENVLFFAENAINRASMFRIDIKPYKQIRDLLLKKINKYPGYVPKPYLIDPKFVPLPDDDSF